MTLQMVQARNGLKIALVLLSGLAWSGTATAEAPCRIAVLGDSLAAGYGLMTDDAFPAELGRALDAAGFDCDVLDAGVSGDTAAGGRSRLDWTLGDEPSHVIVELGGNDGLRGLPPAQMEDNIGAILSRLADEGIPTLLAGMLAPPNYGEDYGEEFKAVFARLAEDHDVAFYPFFLDGVAAVPELNQRDGIHPNEEGVDEIVRRILPAVTAWLEASGVAPSASAEVAPDEAPPA